MIEFVSIAVHGAVVYLHILLARKLFAEPDRSFEILVFGYMMMLFAVLHTAYAGIFIADIYDMRNLFFVANLTATLLLLCTSPFFAPMMLGGLTVLPKRFDLLARVLRPLATHPRRTFFSAFSITAALIVWTLQDLDRVMPALMDAKEQHDERVKQQGKPTKLD